MAFNINGAQPSTSGAEGLYYQQKKGEDQAKLKRRDGIRGNGLHV